jgi:hypothetical protein
VQEPDAVGVVVQPRQESAGKRPVGGGIAYRVQQADQAQAAGAVVHPGGQRPERDGDDDTRRQDEQPGDIRQPALDKERQVLQREQHRGHHGRQPDAPLGLKTGLHEAHPGRLFPQVDRQEAEHRLQAQTVHQRREQRGGRDGRWTVDDHRQQQREQRHREERQGVPAK